MSEQITNKLSELSNELEMPMDKVVEIMQKQVFTIKAP